MSLLKKQPPLGKRGTFLKGRPLSPFPFSHLSFFCIVIRYSNNVVKGKAFYSISQNTPQLAEVPQLTEGMNGQGRRHCRAIVLIEYLNKTRTRRGKIPAMGDVL
jgi:hypothetical protein